MHRPAAYRETYSPCKETTMRYLNYLLLALAVASVLALPAYVLTNAFDPAMLDGYR